MANTMMMDDRNRALLEARVMKRLQEVDEGTLRELETWLAQPLVGDSASAPAKLLTRRQAIAAALLGGTAVIGAGVAGNALSREAPAPPDPRIAAMTETISGMDANMAQLRETTEAWQSRAEALGSELAEARSLLSLHEELEGVGLDDVVSNGLSAMVGALGLVGQTAQSVREGLTVARANINQLDEGLAFMDSGLLLLEGVVSRLSALVQGLEDTLSEAGEPLRPLTTALGSFFTNLISKIPFGVGDRINETIDRVQALVGAIPESIENINQDVIEPLRARLFPREGEEVQVRLLEPITALLFTPVERLLGHLATLGETWQDELQQPAQEKLRARTAIRKQISSVRGDLDS